jgi:hypothetical protein
LVQILDKIQNQYVFKPCSRMKMRSTYWLQAILLALIINTVFLGVSFTSVLVSQEKIIERIRYAFETGELIEDDYFRYDPVLGRFQYNDCNILQMITNEDSSITGRALGPWLHTNKEADDVCHILHELIVDGRNPTTLFSHRYTRYWHGYIPVISALLTFLEISTVRTVLRGFVFISVLILFIVSVWKRYFFPLTGVVAIMGLFFWGLPYFGQGFSHALGDSMVVLGIACLVIFHRKFSNLSTLILFCTLYGAVIVYFEMLTGKLPTAAGLLFPTIYVISRSAQPTNQKPINNFSYAIKGLIAFALGAAITLGARVVTAATLVKPHGLEIFFGNLSFYTQKVGTEWTIIGFLSPLDSLLRKGEVLVYGSNLGLKILYLTTAIIFIISLWLAFKRGTQRAWFDIAAFVVGMASIPVWTVILPNHTVIHAGMMARILIVPISLSWAAFFWQLSEKVSKSREI